MKPSRIIVIALSFIVILSFSVFADEEEFSGSANIDYSYDARYDERESKEDTTSNNSDDIKESYNERYDESEDKEITSNNYDNKAQTYDSEYDERKDVNANNINYGIKVIINGKQIDFDVQPMIINDRTMVPMRAIFEALGAEVSWNNLTQTAVGETKKTKVKIIIGKDYLLKNDNIVVLDSPAIIVSDRTLVPVRAIAESLDCKVEWYGDTQVVEILK